MLRFAFLFLLYLIPLCNTAQENWCGTLGKEYYKGTYRSIYNQRFKQGAYQDKDCVLVFPVVVHIIHFSGIGDISDNQVRDGMRVINEDFRRKNADTINTSSLFKPFAADTKIEFHLAKKDPQGNPTTGIVRYDTLLWDGGPSPLPSDTLQYNNVKFISIWPPNKYLNIWIVNDIYGGVIKGYAQFPGSGFAWGGPWETYGAVVEHDRWGTIGTSVDDGRVPAHELGHCLGLYHTFTHDNGAWSGAKCDTSGDEVCDTPPCVAMSHCQASNTILVTDTLPPSPFKTDPPDMIENYMGYNKLCQNMFTKGQKKRMRSFIFAIDTLKKLTSKENLIATGLLTPSSISSSMLDKVFAYPNPVKKQLIIDSPFQEAITFILYSNTGQQIHRGSFWGKKVLNLQDLASGIYFLRLSKNDENVLRKFVRQ